MACAAICLGDLNARIEIVRRSLQSAAPGIAEPVHSYAPVFAVRARIQTKAGASEFSRVEINGTRVTHHITIRHTSIAFDIRDRVRDGSGSLYSILSIENMDEGNRWFRLFCAKQGAETANAVR